MAHQTQLEKVNFIIQDDFDPAPRISRKGEALKFNMDDLEDCHIRALGRLSTEESCDVLVKRSGSGLVIIIKVNEP